jgi:glutamate formiminotransferase
VIECVPNFSEGRDLAVVRGIVAAIESVRGVLLLGWESDRDHNRSVVTFAGDQDSVLEAAIRGAGEAAKRIDLRLHQGVHPRVGAADVIPFVPLEEATMDDCVRVAHLAGEEIWRRFGVPSYFYESAALAEHRRRLENVRHREFDGNPPDAGDIASHPSAGACVVGARDFLIAFNVNLQTPDVTIAQKIARRIRGSSGGFRFVKAMGRYLASKNCAQVSMNITNFVATPLDQVYAAIAAESPVASCQLVGFVPRRAFDMFPDFFRRAENFDESRVIENRIATIKASAG